MVESKNGDNFCCVPMAVEGLKGAKVGKMWSLHLRSCGLVEREWNTRMARWPESSNGGWRVTPGPGSATGVGKGWVWLSKQAFPTLEFFFEPGSCPEKRVEEKSLSL